ncbi:MAG: UDP-N-acetylmuramate dehydrogenase [Bacteroidales bacterium]|nr:UDP-N-acetylmuramate dehydrogenase [Bacteroidales bacterium]
MEIKENFNLKSLNTFGINVDAKYFCSVASIEDLKIARKFALQNNIPLLVIGGGSNLLFAGNFNGLVIKINLMGVEVLKENPEHVFIKVAAGENWDSFVQYCAHNGFAGIENLSLIPGNVGASPIQNIGAYGVEMRDHFEELEFYNFESEKVRAFNEKECAFGYRYSIFKGELKDKGVILSVTYRLDKVPVFKTGYGTVRDELNRMEVKELSINSIREAVIRIRKSKLPDPAEIGNAGSFFKNPSISAVQHDILKKQYPDLVSFAQSDNTYKLAAGWLIDCCGWKGYREGNAGVHDRQALVLVNHSNASGMEILNLSEKIQKSVFEKFGVALELEVNVV